MSINKLTSLPFAILLVMLATQAFATPENKDWNKLLDEVQSESPSFFIGIIKTKKSKGKKGIENEGLSDDEVDKKKSELKKAIKEKRRIRKLSKKLLKAARSDDYERVKEYVLAGADPKYSKKDGVTPLHIAAAHGNLHIVRVLETHGADLNATTVKDWTPLHHAARFGHLEVVRYLMGKGANMHLINSDGKNPYILARQIKHDDIVNYMKIWRKYH